jgi:uncharacterized protein
MTATEASSGPRRGVFPTIMAETAADEHTRPFWEAARQDRLVVPRCQSCGTFRLPPNAICYACQSEGVDWVELAGTGTVFSFTVIRHPLHPDLVEVVPYVSAIVELDGVQKEGARILVNIIDCEPEEIEIGSRVEIVFEHVNDDMSTPRFRPLRDKES